MRKSNHIKGFMGIQSSINRGLSFTLAINTGITPPFDIKIVSTTSKQPGSFKSGFDFTDWHNNVVFCSEEYTLNSSRHKKVEDEPCPFVV